MSLYLSRVQEDVEAGLRDIDFDEVTTDDRITFVECAIAWQVRLALRCGRFDLAVELQRLGAERIADLYERTRLAAHPPLRGAVGVRPRRQSGAVNHPDNIALRRPTTGSSKHAGVG